MTQGKDLKKLIDSKTGKRKRSRVKKNIVLTRCPAGAWTFDFALSLFPLLEVSFC